MAHGHKLRHDLFARSVKRARLHLGPVKEIGRKRLDLAHGKALWACCHLFGLRKSDRE